MAQIANPKKAFNFNVIAAGLNPYAVQEVNIPDFEVDIIEHGDIAHVVKTAGLARYGNITMTKLRPLGIGDNWIWDWIQMVRNSYTGTGALASQYKRALDIVQLSYDHATVTDRWEIDGAFPAQVNNMGLSRTSSENSMESIEISVDRARKTL